jgi:predicted flap endonuclease-1-like 5' DNA nuclease
VTPAVAAAPPLNAVVASRLSEVARLLRGQGADPFRADAWERAAGTVRGLRRAVSDVYGAEGMRGLERLPGVGPTIARALRDLVVTGRLGVLERLRGEADPVALLRSVTGIGPILAERLHHSLGIDSLEDLEAAAQDGRLDRVAGLGAKRVAGIADTLASRLGRLRPPRGAGERPPVAELLDVDREYREKAASGALPRIAPRRFNPTREAWLPMLHTRRGPRAYTALFSNTAHAHRLGRTHDWVILYYDGAGREGQATVVTASRGPLSGERVVAGREEECARLSAPV